MATDLCLRSVTELAADIRRGDVSPVEAVEAYLDRIETRNGELCAYTTVLDTAAKAKAKRAAAAVERGDETGPLHGVPVAIKDLFAPKAGVRHTYGSTVFEDNVADRTAPVVERLEAAGAIVLGKTSTPEFGNRPVTDSELVGTTVTPFDPSKVAGGTSGGSAVAVAAGMAAAAQGSDAGGSIRIPAAFCGVYGLKPSFGRVPNGSRPNAFAEHTPFVQHGPLTRTVADAALLLDVMAGPHPDDPFTHPESETPFTDHVGRPVDEFEVAYSSDLGLFRIEDEVRDVVEASVDALATAGATVERVDVEFDRSKDEIQDAWRTFFQVLLADVARGIEETYGIDLLADHRSEIDPLFVKIVEAGRSHSVMAYKRADTVRTDVYDTVQEVFSSYDLLVTPTVAVPPFDATEMGPTEIAGEPSDPFIDWMLCWLFNMTDHPAASVPAGFTDDGLPVGLQVVGSRFADGDVLAASAAIENVRPWQDAYERLELEFGSNI